MTTAKKSQMTTAKTPTPTSEGVRLNRYLAMAGVGSRRACDTYITEGRVSVNGEVVTRLGTRVDPDRDEVRFDDAVVTPTTEVVYVLLHKPLRTVTTVKDDKRRRTVMDLVGADERLFPVGRLDYDTTGALLLTNDGDLAYYLMHPRFEVNKVYRVMLDRIIRPIDLHNFRKGIDLDGRRTAPCGADELRRIGNRSYLEITLHEGRNRQIRRMFEVLGYQVEELHRLSFAGLGVADMKPGEWRELRSGEVADLKALVARQKTDFDAAEHSS